MNSCGAGYDMGYYLGLDIGTNSIGWAVTDLNYNIIKIKGKALWGIRLFDEAKTAAERRTFRAARRRLQRRKERIALLQELFAEEIAKVDFGFYQRLSESGLWMDDRSDTNRQKNALFCDANFQDVNFYKRYPTIYHLRNELLNSKEPHDVRLVYLAVHHILKHRGHFLFAGKKLEEVQELKTAYDTFAEVSRDECGIEWGEIDLGKLEEILVSKSDGVRAKKKRLLELFSVNKKSEQRKQKEAILKLLAGDKAKLTDLFAESSLEGIGGDEKLSFADVNVDETLLKLADSIPEQVVVLQCVKALYDWSMFAGTMQGHMYFSEAKAASYEKHREDLKRLKAYIRKNCKASYDDLFRNPDAEGSYSSYVMRCSTGGENERSSTPIKKRGTQDAFYAYLKKILTNASATEERESILQEIEKKTFLPLQKSGENGVVPNQMQALELKIILENASAYLSFLKEPDENGLTVIEKLCGADQTMGLINYRIPYYIGPLNPAHKEGGFAWIVRRGKQKIYPWNFDEIVDREASAEQFIRRMTNKCTYLTGEDVLPKDSLLYSKYMVLNEINNIKIDGDKLPVELKQRIYQELFCKKKKVRKKDLIEFLKSNGYLKNEKEAELEGFDGDFKSSLASYIDWRRLCEKGEIPKADFEKIVQTIVLFGEDKKMLRNRLRSYVYLTEEQIKEITRLKYKDWGRFSRMFLEGITAVDHETGELISIIGHMWETNDNLMQTLRGELGFKEAVEDYCWELAGEKKISYESVEALHVSPAVKRPVWQTLQIIQELQKLLGGGRPKRIFVEVTRSEGENKRTVSRKDQLKELYKACKGEEQNWIEEIDRYTEADFRSNLLYLYYIQMGRDMYTGNRINLDELYNKNVYDKDHIWPQSKTNV